MKHTQATQGFTLIEVLIAMACVAVLVTVAWPSYQSLTGRGQRAQARTAWLKAEHWFGPLYTSDATDESRGVEHAGMARWLSTHL